MAAAKDGFQSMQLTPEQALAVLQSDPHALIVDVREPWEWEQEHIAHAISLPLSNAKPSDFDRLGKERPLLILCAHGNRSGGVTQFLRERGFVHAQNMSGGISVISPTLREQLGKLLEGRKPYA